MRLLKMFISVAVVLLPSFAAAEELPVSVAEFLATRQVVIAVTFAPGSTTLSSEAQLKLKESLEQLRNLDNNRYLLRIEGFTSPEGGAELNVSLAMRRAEEVELYLRKQPGLPNNRSLTGIGIDPDTTLAPDQQRRVEIARYDNILQFDELPAEKITLH